MKFSLPLGPMLTKTEKKIVKISIFKIAIFGHETWQLAKVPESAHMLSFYPRRVEIELSFALQAAVSKIRAIFLTCHIWA